MAKYKVKIINWSIFGKKTFEAEVEGTVEEIKALVPKEVEI